MRARYPSIVLAAALIVVTPSPASAQFLEFMEWLDRLSGPRFYGQFIEIPVACVTQGGDPRLGDCTPIRASRGRLARSDRRVVFGLRLGRQASGVGDAGWDRTSNNLRYPEGTPDRDKRIDLYTLGGSVIYQIEPWVDVFTAVERSYFIGPRVDSFSVWSVSPGVVIKPAALFSDSRLARLFKVQARRKFFRGTMTAEQFGAIPGTFREENEAVWGYGFGLDWIF